MQTALPTTLEVFPELFFYEFSHPKKPPHNRLYRRTRSPLLLARSLSRRRRPAGHFPREPAGQVSNHAVISSEEHVDSLGVVGWSIKSPDNVTAALN